jgi:hypothetical protein
MNQRRNFLKGVGIASAFVAGVAAYKQVKEIAENSKDIRHFAPPDNAQTIQFTGAYGEAPKPVHVDERFRIGSSSYYINGYNSEVTHKVAMTVGKDNRLWIKVGDEWRRVALEG